MFQSGQPPPMSKSDSTEQKTLAPVFFLFIIILLSLVLKNKAEKRYNTNPIPIEIVADNKVKIP